MSVVASLPALSRSILPPRGVRALTVSLFVLALVVGALATVKPMYAIALVGAAVVGLIVMRSIASLPYFLVFTMFVESVSLGPGLRIGRVFGAMAILVLALTLLTRGRGGLKPTPLLALAGAYGLWILASALWAWSPSAVLSVTFSYVLSASYALTFAVLVRDRRQLVGIGRVLAIGSALFGAIAFAYYARHAGAAADAASINDAGNRAAGLQGDPNYFAIFQVIALPAALVLAAGERDRRLRAVYYGAVGLIVISVISSLSRSGLIALTLAVLLTLFVPWRIFFRVAQQKMTYLLAIVAGAGAAIAIGSTALVARVQTILDPNAQGSYRGAGRQDLWAAALHGWHESNRLLGIGAGNFAAHSLDLLQSTPGVDTTQNYIGPDRPVHNAYLENLTELGVIGLVLFLLLLFVTGRSLLHSFRRARAAGDLDLQRFSVAFLVSLVAYSVSAAFLSNQLAKALWILIGIALALEVMTRRAVPVTVPAYDAPVDRELEAIRLRLVTDQERLDRRRAALDEREREIARRIAERVAVPAQPAPAEPDPRIAELEQTLAARDVAIATLRTQVEQLEASVAAPSPQVAALEKILEARDAAIETLRGRVEGLEARLAAPSPQVTALEKLLANRDRTIESLRRELAAVESAVTPPVAVEEPEPEPQREPEPAPVEPASPPEPPAPDVPAPVLPVGAIEELEPVPGRWNLTAIELAIARHADDPRGEEWQAYALFLRDHAELSGLLPISFDALVDEVFGDLIARVRAGG